MALRSLGVVALSSGGPVPLTNAQADPTKPVLAGWFRVYHWPGNVGKIYVGEPAMETQSGDGVTGWVPELSPIPNINLLYYESPMASTRPAPYDLSQVYVDGDVPSDNVLVAYVEL